MKIILRNNRHCYKCHWDVNLVCQMIKSCEKLFNFIGFDHMTNQVHIPIKILMHEESENDNDYAWYHDTEYY